jgi:hypothetical protein
MANVNPIKYRTAFTMRVDEEFLDALEQLRKLESPIPTKSDAIRAAVMEVLAARKARKRKGGA